ncbi:MAG: hypothetical protein KME06_07425 [Kastovskya adunca ATA6-11-RM4]|nr:hypothetical protein [Kastovskya adunca ATA6-11-RM4]
MPQIETILNTILVEPLLEEKAIKLKICKELEIIATKSPGSLVVQAIGLGDRN